MFDGAVNGLGVKSSGAKSPGADNLACLFLSIHCGTPGLFWIGGLGAGLGG
jgi:hypothetical protein